MRLHPTTTVPRSPGPASFVHLIVNADSELWSTRFLFFFYFMIYKLRSCCQCPLPCRRCSPARRRCTRQSPRQRPLRRGDGPPARSWRFVPWDGQRLQDCAMRSDFSAGMDGQSSDSIES
jgi:hypothetical protein